MSKKPLKPFLKAKKGPGRTDEDAKRAKKVVEEETKQLHVHLSARLYDKFFARARDDGQNVSKLVRRWVEKYTN